MTGLGYREGVTLQDRLVDGGWAGRQRRRRRDAFSEDPPEGKAKPQREEVEGNQEWEENVGVSHAIQVGVSEKLWRREFAPQTGKKPGHLPGVCRQDLQAEGKWTALAGGGRRRPGESENQRREIRSAPPNCQAGSSFSVAGIGPPVPLPASGSISKSVSTAGAPPVLLPHLSAEPFGTHFQGHTVILLVGPLGSPARDIQKLVRGRCS